MPSRQSSGQRYSRKTFLTATQERELMDRWHDSGDRSAADALVRAYDPLIKRITSKFAPYATSQKDLEQEAMWGFMQALNRFDRTQNVRLSTYAPFWIKEACRKYTMQKQKSIPIPMKTRQKLFQTVQQSEEAMTGNSGQSFNRSEDDRPTLAEQYLATETIQSLDAPATSEDDDEGSTPLIALIKEHGRSPEDEVAETDEWRYRAKLARNALNRLNVRERRVITLRYLTNTGATLHTVAKELNVSKERVRQIEVRALRQLRDGLAKTEREKGRPHLMKAQ